MIYYLIVIIGVLACSVCQLLLKKSAIEKHRLPIYNLLNWKVLISYSIMLISLVTNIYAMKKGVMLKDMPILEATGYIFVPVLTYFFFKEKINRMVLLSIFLIISGIIIFYM